MIADRATPTIQYCPICLGRGATAHSRRGWRSALDVVCSIDGCFLRDSCWRCGCLLSPLLLTVPCRELLCVACGASLAKAPSLRMDATTSDQLMLDCGIAHRDLAIERRGERAREGLHRTRSSGGLRGTNPANSADRHIAVVLQAARSPMLSHAPRTDVAREPGRAFACRRRQRHPPCGVSGRRLAQLMAGDIRARAKGDRREWRRLVQCHHTLAGQLQTGEQRARHGRPSP